MIRFVNYEQWKEWFVEDGHTDHLVLSKECPKCEGGGEYDYYDEDEEGEGFYSTEPCDKCDGTGYLKKLSSWEESQQKEQILKTCYHRQAVEDLCKLVNCGNKELADRFYDEEKDTITIDGITVNVKDGIYYARN